MGHVKVFTYLCSLLQRLTLNRFLFHILLSLQKLLEKNALIIETKISFVTWKRILIIPYNILQIKVLNIKLVFWEKLSLRRTQDISFSEMNIKKGKFVTTPWCLHIWAWWYLNSVKTNTWFSGTSKNF